MKMLLAMTMLLFMTAPFAFSKEESNQVILDVAPLRSTLKAGEKQTTWLRVGMEGFNIATEKKRAPVNLAIVLDKSGSMSGQKIDQARRAAIDALRMLQSNDIVSVVTYDTTVSVLVPATKMSDRESIEKAIRSIQADGSTALYDGVTKGAAELRKFFDKERVNRIVLLSDGLANSGPSSPAELAALGASLSRENISVSTLGLGLGYNEDLMVQLAQKSGGNHHFIENATELADIFRREFEDVLSVVAQEVEMKVRISEGIRPVRVLGNDAEINGQQILTHLAQIYSRQKKYVVIEVEIPASEVNATRELANVSVSYANMKTHVTDRLSSSSSVRFSQSHDEVEKSLNKAVLADVVALVSSENNKLATKYLDEGNLEMSRKVLRDNVEYLNKNGSMVPEDKRLRGLSTANAGQLHLLEAAGSNKDESALSARKGQLFLQNGIDTQQRTVTEPSKP
jgi:Ca-activated chloride channel homolog